MKPRKKEEKPLARSLAQRVGQLREQHNMTVLDLAKACRFPVERIEAIEGGLEVWLSVHDRSLLARALRVVPAVIQEAEATPEELFEGKARPEPSVDLEELAERVLAGEVELYCPKCGNLLKTSIETALDHEGIPTNFARAYCPICPFAIR